MLDDSDAIQADNVDQSVHQGKLQLECIVCGILTCITALLNLH